MKQRVLLHQGSLFEMESEWPQAPRAHVDSKGQPLPQASVILVSGEALDDTRVEKVANGLERCEKMVPLIHPPAKHPNHNQHIKTLVHGLVWLSLA